MSLLNNVLKNNVITTEIKSMASYVPGIIVGEGQKLYDDIPTYNVKVYRGNFNVEGYNTSTIHLNVPISKLNNTTKTCELKAGDPVLLGKLNNDENAFFIINGGNSTSKSSSYSGDYIAVNPSEYTYTGDGEYTTGESDTTYNGSTPVFGTSPSSFGGNVFIRGDADDPIPEKSVFGGETYNTGSQYTYMNWNKLSSYVAGGSKEDNSKSRQALLRWTAVNANHAKLTDGGYWMIGNRFCVAMTYWYHEVYSKVVAKKADGSEAVGSVCDVYLRDGTIIPVIIADIKSLSTDSGMIYGHNNGACIVEFITDWPDGHANHPRGPGVKMVINGGNYLDNPDLAFTSKITVSDNSNNKSNTGGKKICIDPGHNNNSWDTGAAYHGYREQDIVFEISIRIKSILEKRGYMVKLTRESIKTNLGNSTNSSLRERVQISKNFGAELFFSIHCNANTVASANGTEVFYNPTVNGSSQKASSLSSLIAESLGTNNRGAKTQSLHVVNNQSIPSFLIEVGFISNKDKDLPILLDYEKCANAIADAIEKTW